MKAETNMNIPLLQENKGKIVFVDPWLNTEHGKDSQRMREIREVDTPFIAMYNQKEYFLEDVLARKNVNIEGIIPFSTLGEDSFYVFFSGKWNDSPEKYRESLFAHLEANIKYHTQAIFVFYLEHMGSSTIIFVRKLRELLTSFAKTGRKVSVVWLYHRDCPRNKTEGDTYFNNRDLFLFDTYVVSVGEKRKIKVDHFSMIDLARQAQQE